MKIKINKFKSLENLTFSIPSQIRSGNGFGKSTILEAISFVLTGKNLDGKEFEQVYDNRVDLHDAIADVSYFDNYGNEYQRIVKPIFQTNRAGIEEIKIKRSTEYRKNGIAVNDFSDEFVDFYKFGTDYFFNQKEDLQRSIFIYILKSKMPKYDVVTALAQKKQLKKAQDIDVARVDFLKEENKNTKDVPVPEIPTDIEKLNAEYLTLQNSSNSDVVYEINKKNNLLMSDFFDKKGQLELDISNINFNINKTKQNIQSETEKLEGRKNAKFAPKEHESTIILEQDIEALTRKLNGLEYFESIENYAAKYFSKNPVLVENKNKIKEITRREFFGFDKVSSACPLSGEICETARLNSEKSFRISFDRTNSSEIEALMSENRYILTKEMNTVNSDYNSAKFDLQEAERKLNRIIEANKLVESDNEHLKSVFESQNLFQIDLCEKNIERLENGLKELKKQLTGKQTEFSQLIEPTLEKLPEQLEISDELKDAHTAFELLKIDINKAIGVNENNVKLIAERSKEIKEKQANLLIIGEKIVTLTQEISDYFSNLSGVVKQEFAGDIEIDVELLEYVMSRDEYKDCFKITANGKVFPYECNGALQNNVKMQVLFNLQRLKGYTGVTVMDNCEANTSQPINTLGLNCVLAFATYDNELIIK